MMLAVTSLPRIYTSLIYCCELVGQANNKYVYFFSFGSMFLFAGTMFHLIVNEKNEFFTIYICFLSVINAMSFIWFYTVLPESPLFLYKLQHYESFFDSLAKIARFNKCESFNSADLWHSRPNEQLPKKEPEIIKVTLTDSEYPYYPDSG